MTKAERERDPSETFDGGYHLYAKEAHKERVAKNSDRISYAIVQFERNNMEEDVLPGQMSVEDFV